MKRVNGDKWRNHGVAALLCAGVLLAATAIAQDQPEGTGPMPEQQKLMAKRAAEADAYRKLAEAVYGLQINSSTYVRDFVAESDDIRSGVDAFVKGIRLGQATWYDDLSCEVPAEVTTAKVIETLREVHKRSYHGKDVRVDDFETMTKRTEKRVIKVVGMGAPRFDLPPELPEGVAEQLGGSHAPQAPGTPPPIPDLWRKVAPQARLMAVEAARKDAQRKLAERLKGLRLTSRTTVRDFVTESDEIRADMAAFLVGAEQTQVFLHHNELIAEVTMRVPTSQVIETIKKMSAREYHNEDVKGFDVEKVVKTIVKKDFEATGMGVPPARFLKQAAEVRGEELPDWATTVVEATGEGTDPEFGTAQGRLKATRAAEMDARRKLAEQVAGMTIQSETMVSDFITQSDVVASELDAVIVDASITKTEVGADSVRVTVSVPAIRVWSTVSAEMKRRGR